MEMTFDKIVSMLLKGFGSQRMEDIGFLPFFLLMIISLLSSMLISYLYIKFYRNRATGSQIHRSFPLLGIAITAIFISIQFSLPLSLGLLGALSIVRFRTPIKICCATFNILFLGILLLISYVGLLIITRGPHFLKARLDDGMLLVTVPSGEYRVKSANILNYLDEKIPRGKIESILESEDESVISYSFNQINKNMLLQMQSELNELAAGLKSNVFFNRIGDV